MLDFFPLPKGSLSGPHTTGGWYVSSYFGGRADPITGIPGTHGGQDIVGPTGTPMYAVKSGVKVQGWDGGGGGNWTMLYADDGTVYGYGHAQSFAGGPSGSRVEAGELLAYMNSTGHSTGSHLHFARKAKGQYAYSDPFDELQEAADAGRFVGEHPPATTPEDPDRKCGPGAGDEILHIIGTDPRDGKAYEICGLHRRYIETPEDLEIIRTNVGIEDRGDIATQVIDSRVLLP